MAEMRIRNRQAFVGRDPEADVVVSDPRVSRRHAVIRIDGKGASIEVLPTATREGLVRHNGAAPPRGVSVDLATGDVLTFGSSPEYRVTLGRLSVVLEWSDLTERAPTDLSLRIAVHPAAAIPPELAANFDVAGDLAEVTDESIDAVVVLGAPPRPVVEMLAGLRAKRFFLPQLFVGTPAPASRIGDAYVELERDDPRIADRLRAAVEEHQGREHAALPYRTGEILHLEGDTVLAHDWGADRPRHIELSELQHQVMWVLATDRREGGQHGGLGVSEVAERLEQRRWARATHTIANELSARLPRQLADVGLHPLLWAASGTREKRYGLSTPATCIRPLP